MTSEVFLALNGIEPTDYWVPTQFHERRKRWPRMPEFVEQWCRALWQVFDKAYARVQQNSGAAAAVLMKLMADPSTPASGRIRAALGVFDLSRDALDLDIETRVAALEAAAAASGKQRP
jgi:hypothetical protein